MVECFGEKKISKMKFKQVLDVNKVIGHLLQAGKKKTEKQVSLDKFVLFFQR